MDLIIFLSLLLAAFLTGEYLERRHYRSIRARERELNALPAIATRVIDPALEIRETHLVIGSVVISVDYFKRFVAGLRSLFGGRVSSYESLVDRARREALLRMKAEARELGAGLVFNVKLETSSIYKGRGDSIGSVEVLAYGTALVLGQQR